MQRITSEIIEKINGDLSFYKEAHGEQDVFWRSVYVMGYFYGQISTLITILDKRNEITGKDRFNILFDVFNGVAWQPAHLILESCARSIQANDAEFEEALRAGQLVVMCERGELEIDPKLHWALRESIAVAKNVWKEPSREEVLVVLRHIVFTERVTKILSQART